MAKRKQKSYGFDSSFLSEGPLEAEFQLCLPPMLIHQNALSQEDVIGFQPYKSQGLSCSVCLCTAEEVFLKKSLGCSHCYTVFEAYLKDYCAKLHKASQHLGKVPRRCLSPKAIETKLQELEAKLADFVAKECFQDAALVKHMIKTFTARLETLLNTAKKVSS